MAKQTYLEAVNTVLLRISQSTITDIQAATGTAKIVADMYNEAQRELWTENTNWYTLYKQRTFNTTTYTVSSISFTSGNPATISDSANGFGNFVDGQTIMVSGSTSNDNIYMIDKAFNGGKKTNVDEWSQNLIIVNNTSNPNTQVDIDANFITLVDTLGNVYRANDVNLTVDITNSGANGLDTGTETAGEEYYIWAISNGSTDAGLLSISDSSPTMPSGYIFKRLIGICFNDGAGDLVSITKGATASTLTLQPEDSVTTEAAGSEITITAITYPVARDWSRTIDVSDKTNGRIIWENTGRTFDMADPNLDSTGIPDYVSMQSDFYRFFEPPSSSITILDRYWKKPKKLVGNNDVTELPEFCENFLIYWTWMMIANYIENFEVASSLRIQLYGGIGNLSAEKLSMLSKAKVANQKILNKMNVVRSDEITHGNLFAPRFPSNYGRIGL